MSSMACGGSTVPALSATQPIITSDAQSSTEEAGELPPLPPGVTRCEQLATRLCDDLGPTTDTCEMVRTRTAELEDSHCDVMSAHYAEVIGDLRAYALRNQPLSPENFARMTAGAAATHGPADAAVTIVVFSDFQCPFCAGAATATADVIERYGDRVRVVFRQFPLPFHRNAHTAAEAALAANAEGKFWPMHDLLFANQGSLDREYLTRYAQTLGLNTQNFEAALDRGTYAAAVDADLNLGVELGVNGTPTMFLNGAKVPNAGDAEALTARIDAILNSATSTPSPQ